MRNFCILAHVDHGKSTLCDRFLELTGTVSHEKLQPQYLDSNPISRERGITIKLAPVRMIYNNYNGYNSYILNLIDTPGHVDFSYEVSRSLAACEGAIFLVDATQGIQAQTLSYFEKAKNQNLVMIPVVNKIDLPIACPEDTALSLIKTFGFRQDEVVFVSAKTGEGVEALLLEIIKRVPAPAGSPDEPLRALVFDSFYDQHKGVIAAVRVVDGEINNKDKLQFMASKAEFIPVEIGYFMPEPTATVTLENGSVGYLATGLKDISLTRIGDTITNSNLKSQSSKPLPGYQQPKAMVFVGVYPIDQDKFGDLGDALGKLRLNDSSFSYAPENSLALGKGFRMGFLGPLHAEVVIQRLEREFGLELITTAPNVAYQFKVESLPAGQAGSKLKVTNIAEIPQKYDEILEPIVKGTILTPAEYLGEIMKLCQEHRGKQLAMEYLDRQIKLVYELPLSEIISDFFAGLKSVSSGYASFDYDLTGYTPFEGAKVDVYIGGKMIDAFSQIVPKNQACQKGRELVERLFKVIPKQMFEFAIQAAVAGRIIASMTKSAWRKDVTAKLYGGDRTRKDKLLKKQKKGKKRMKAVGQVYIPQEAFLAVLKA